MLLLPFLLFVCIPAIGLSDDPPTLTVDLQSPTLQEGVISTQQGGIITAPGLRIQARCFDYIPQLSLRASGDLMVEVGDELFLADAIHYDLTTREGILYHARVGIEPWYFFAEQLFLHADGSFTLYHGTVTTSQELGHLDWELRIADARLMDQHLLEAHNVKFYIQNIPLLWLPSLKTDLETIFDSPIQYALRWGGRQGVRGSIIYEVMAWERFKLFARLDYRIKRGPGGGFETYYKSEDKKEVFNTINYIAQDNSLSNPHEKTRFRFQGLYKNMLWDDRLRIEATWDKLSDEDMPTDYNDHGLDLQTAGKTQLTVKRQADDRFERLFARARINSFQSLKQELPTYEVLWKPIWSDNWGTIHYANVRASYLDFAYAPAAGDARDYSSPRLFIEQRLERPTQLGAVRFLPEVDAIGIYYGNSPQHRTRFLAIGKAACEAHVSWFCPMEEWRHTVTPYLRVESYTSPTVSPEAHYIFDIEDGWYQLTSMRLGARQEWTLLHPISRPLRIDLFGYYFPDAPHQIAPKIYLEVHQQPFSIFRYDYLLSWDLQHNELDQCNIRTAWTVATNLALHMEYRHRSPYVWRKAVWNNFLLDAFRSQQELLDSPLSDRRDTLLAAFFYQLNPQWAIRFEARHGWNRPIQPSYTEFQVDLLGTLRSASNVKLSYERREGEDRFAIYFWIGLKKPSFCTPIPCLDL